jgi:hypothetical protein
LLSLVAWQTGEIDSSSLEWDSSFAFSSAIDRPAKRFRLFGQRLSLKSQSIHGKSTCLKRTWCKWDL